MGTEFIQLAPAKRHFTVIDNLFIDRLMPAAPGEFVKVYLLLNRLRSAENGLKISVSELADTLQCTEGDIRRALKYWQDKNVWEDISGNDSPENNIRESITLENVTLENIRPDTGSPDDKETDNSPLSSSSDCAEDRLRNEAVCEILFVGEQYFGRPLSATEAEKLTSFYTQLHLTVEVITYLMEYCIENNHKSIHYMEKVAADWAQAKVRTVSQASEQAERFFKSTSSILKEFGISGRVLADSESALVKKWQREYGFSSELILLACRKTISAIHQPSFEYADKILSSWLANRVSTIEDVESLDQKRRREKTEKQPAGQTFYREESRTQKTKNMNNFEERSYDMSELERQLLGGAPKPRP